MFKYYFCCSSNFNVIGKSLEYLDSNLSEETLSINDLKIKLLLKIILHNKSNDLFNEKPSFNLVNNDVDKVVDSFFKMVGNLEENKENDNNKDVEMDKEVVKESKEIEDFKCLNPREVDIASEIDFSNEELNNDLRSLYLRNFL